MNGHVGSTASEAVGARGTLVPLAQKRFAIRLHSALEVSEESLTPEGQATPPPAPPLTASQRRFEIRMGADDIAPCMMAQPEVCEIRPQVVSSSSLAQNRYAIRMHGAFGCEAQLW